MGVLGPGLYSSDFALDLRSTIGAVVRLPFDPDKLVDIVCGTQPSSANDPGDEEHTIFWLVLADQFAKRGIACERLQTKALRILDRGDDIAMLERLGLKPADLRKRQGMLAELRSRIVAAPAKIAARKVLRSPQPLIMDTGDVLVFPTCDGVNINPYYASKEKQALHSKAGSRMWVQNSWGAIVIVDCGRAFDFLAWYRPATLAEWRTEKPKLDSLRGAMLWNLHAPGTCSASHSKKMELEKIGRLPVDSHKVAAAFPKRIVSGVSAAVQDISIANSMKSAAPCTAVPNSEGTQKGRPRTLSAIEQIS